MADRLWRAQVSIPLDSGVPEDAIVNTWHFDDDDDPIATPSSTDDFVMTLLTSFYNAIDNVLLPNTVGDLATVKMYDMAAPEPRVPLFTNGIAITPTGSPPMAGEVALCLSFAAAMESGVPPARRRGRIYIGPIAQSCGEVVNSQLRPTTAARNALRDAADVMQAGYEHPASPGYRCRWSIYSPTTRAAGGTVGAAFNDVLSGWVDDAFDTQRRRGPKATTRAVFTS